MNTVLVGTGATSLVVKACRKDHPEKQYAIKKIKNVFDHKLFARRTLRELKVLRALKGHDNVRPKLNNFSDNFDKRTSVACQPK